MQKVKARARRTQLRRRGILCGSQHLPWYGAARMPGLAACRDANYPGSALGPKPRCSPQVSSKWVRHGGSAMFSVGTAVTELAAGGQLGFWERLSVPLVRPITKLPSAAQLIRNSLRQSWTRPHRGLTGASFYSGALWSFLATFGNLTPRRCLRMICTDEVLRHGKARALPGSAGSGAAGYGLCLTLNDSSGDATLVDTSPRLVKRDVALASYGASAALAEDTNGGLGTAGRAGSGAEWAFG
jgi:hypothetical protein